MLARAGLGSRRRCELLIAEGRVLIDDEVAALGERVEASSVEIRVDGVLINTDPGLAYYLLAKPLGVICSAAAGGELPTAVSLVPPEPRVWTVGRLDVDTEGLLICTNDGNLTQLLTHPSHGVEKEYLAHVDRTPSRAALRSLRTGVELEDGLTAPAKVSTPGDGLVRLVISEGRNRQVRRMLESVGHPVRRLVRTRIGPITDTRLGPGEHRRLLPEEVHSLRVAASEGSEAPE